MAAPLLTQLYEKVQRAAAEISTLRKERESLTAEIALMEEENKRARRVLREHQELMAERERLKEKLERLMHKLEQLRV